MRVGEALSKEQKDETDSFNVHRMANGLGNWVTCDRQASSAVGDGCDNFPIASVGDSASRKEVTEQGAPLLPQPKGAEDEAKSSRTDNGNRSADQPVDVVRRAGDSSNLGAVEGVADDEKALDHPGTGGGGGGNSGAGDTSGDGPKLAELPDGDGAAAVVEAQTAETEPAAAEGENPEPLPQIPEPLADIPEPVQVSPEPSAEEIPEPASVDTKQRTYEIPEPFQQMPEPVKEIPEPDPAIPELAVDNPEPFEVQTAETEPAAAEGEIEINADEAFSKDYRLWNLETYKDRHGKHRAKRVLRFVSKPPKIEIGKITEEIAEELRSRRGKGRWKLSRDEAEEYRGNAELVAESIRRDKGQRNSGGNDGHAGGSQDSVSGSPLLPDTQNASQWGELPAWRM